MRRIASLSGAASIVCAVLVATAAPAAAAGHGHTITPGLVKDGYAADPSWEYWYREDTTLGTATLSRQYGAPTGYSDGALVLATSNDTTAKVRLLTYHIAYGTPMADVTDIGYWTYHPSTTARADDEPFFIVRIDLDGNYTTTGDVTDLVYDPRANQTDGPDPQQPIAPDVWQFWDATNGAWTVNKQIVCGTFVVDPGGGPTGTTSPAAVATNCPAAVGDEFGVGIGPATPNAVVAADGLVYSTTNGAYTWNFQPK